MNSCVVTILTMFSIQSMLSSAFLSADCGRTLIGATQLFQSSIALQEDRFRHDDSCCREQVQARKISVEKNVYFPARTSKSIANKNKASVDAEERMASLRSMSLKELKLACSRRNIQYGKFSDTEEYIEAIWQDMQKAITFSVTGLVQPGAMVELTQEQLEQELTDEENPIVVDVFATWCGPCRVIVPQLQVAAKKMAGDKVRVVKIDADKHPSWASKYEVEGLPAVLVMKGGRVLDRTEGACTTNQIVDMVQQHIS